MYVNDAVSTLSASGLSDGGTSSEEYSDDYAEGMIIRQSTDAGTKVAEGTSVSYVVSKGRRPADQVKVPTLTGKTLGDAISALNARNLTYTEVDIDSAEPSGKVVKVDPGEGTSVDVGTAITLYVSNGSQASSGSDSNNSGSNNSGNNSNNGNNTGLDASKGAACYWSNSSASSYGNDKDQGATSLYYKVSDKTWTHSSGRSHAFYVRCMKDAENR